MQSLNKLGMLLVVTVLVAQKEAIDRSHELHDNTMTIDALIVLHDGLDDVLDHVD